MTEAEALLEGPPLWREPVALCWSGGKDSALALHALREARLEVAALVTTVTEGFERVSMHGVRRSLVVRQAESLGLPLREVVVPAWPSNEAYEQRMGEAFDALRGEGVRRVAFGDIFLQDLRAYRDRLLDRHGLEGFYPLWERDTRELFDAFCRLGFRAVTVCVDPRVLDASFLGCGLNRDFAGRLPPGADACGENGEYHSFVFDGPGFSFPVGFRMGETVARDGFLFCDLIGDESAGEQGGPDRATPV